MIAITTYQTVDGEIFANEVEALRHENQLLRAQMKSLSAEHNVGIKKNKPNEPNPKTVAYERFMKSYALGYWTPTKKKYEIVPYEDFCTQVDNMGKFAEAKKSFYSLKLKSVRYRATDSLAKCISVMPLELMSMLHTRKSGENQTTLSRSCIRKTPEDGYMYSFVSTTLE